MGPEMTSGSLMTWVTKKIQGTNKYHAEQQVFETLEKNEKKRKKKSINWDHLSQQPQRDLRDLIRFSFRDSLAKASAEGKGPRHWVEASSVDSLDLKLESYILQLTAC